MRIAKSQELLLALVAVLSCMKCCCGVSRTAIGVNNHV